MKKLGDFIANLKEKRENRELRQNPSPCQFAIYDSIEFVNSDHWNQVVPESLSLMRAPYLRAQESSASEDHESRYSIIYKDQKPVAIAIFHLFSLKRDDYGDMNKAKCAMSLSLRVLCCGNTHFSGEHGFLHTGEISSEMAHDALADVIYRIRRGEKLRRQIDLILIKDFYEPEFVAADRFKSYKYRQFEVDPNMVVAIDPDWKSFEDYLAAMKPKYRQRAKAAIKKATELERRHLSVEELIEHQDRISELYDNVSEQADFRIIRLRPEYFIELKKELDHLFEFMGYFLEGKMIAFTSSVFWGEHCEGHTIGLDYEHNKTHALYQNILYDGVHLGIERGVSEVLFGRTAMEMKSTVGAVPKKLRCFMRHPNPVSNRLIKPIFNYIKTTDWTPRSPFKEPRN